MNNSQCDIVDCENKAFARVKMFSNRINDNWITFDLCRKHYKTAHVSRKFKRGEQ